MSTLLQEIAAKKAARVENDRQRMLAALHREVSNLLPRGTSLWVFGSLTRPGRFSDWSDVDIALGDRPTHLSEFQLQGELEHRLGRRVDVILMAESRMREKIEREGLKWTL